ncbi:ribonuclease HII [Candidatus Saccharibacteria bacterium]|nr:MAG: ribonuclease HII [Candidatus Saccharibacteria bacterium]
MYGAYPNSVAVRVGIDEVGRGCWAGPLVAAAVALPDGYRVDGLRDSKKLSLRQREAVVAALRADRALDWALGWVWPAELDAWGMTQAVRQAMRRAADGLSGTYPSTIIDGNYNYLVGYRQDILGDITTLTRADDTVPSVSAASVIAKVARDNYMRRIAAEYPRYGFDAHVGYGTALHRQALTRYGPCALHRRSFAPVIAVLETGSHD